MVFHPCRLEYMFPGVKRSRSWMSFFNHLDEDGSGHVQYGELLQMVRKELKLTADDMPEDSVKALWLALDVDNSNHVTPGEFGVMIMRGVSHKLEGTAEKRAQQNIDDNKAKIKASEEAEKLLVGTNLMKTADLRKDLLERSVPPLEQPELMAMSLIFNRELEYMFPGVDRNRSWKSMFNRVDADNTGCVRVHDPPPSPPHFCLPNPLFCPLGCLTVVPPSLPRHFADTLPTTSWSMSFARRWTLRPRVCPSII